MWFCGTSALDVVNMATDRSRTFYANNDLRLDCVTSEVPVFWVVQNLCNGGLKQTVVPTERKIPIANKYPLVELVYPNNTAGMRTYSMMFKNTHVGLTGFYTCGDHRLELNIRPNITEYEIANSRNSSYPTFNKEVYVGDSVILATILPMDRTYLGSLENSTIDLTHIQFNDTTNQRRILSRSTDGNIVRTEIGEQYFFILISATLEDAGYYVFMGNFDRECAVEVNTLIVRSRVSQLANTTNETYNEVPEHTCANPINWLFVFVCTILGVILGAVCNKLWTMYSMYSVYTTHTYNVRVAATAV